MPSPEHRPRKGPQGPSSCPRADVRWSIDSKTTNKKEALRKIVPLRLLVRASHSSGRRGRSSMASKVSARKFVRQDQKPDELPTISVGSVLNLFRMSARLAQMRPPRPSAQSRSPVEPSYQLRDPAHVEPFDVIGSGSVCGATCAKLLHRFTSSGFAEFRGKFPPVSGSSAHKLLGAFSDLFG